MPIRGKYIVIEGHDGTGKSTQTALLQKRLREHGVTSLIVEEPGSDDPREGVPIANAIRRVIKDGELHRDGMTNILLFSAARHELWHTLIEPALAAGTWVLASRNYISTLAYQGYGEHYDLDDITTLTRQVTSDKYMSPDMTLILHVSSADTRLSRITERDAAEPPKDTFEDKNATFQAAVHKAYLQIAKDHTIPVISADPSQDEVADAVWTHIQKIVSAK